MFCAIENALEALQILLKLYALLQLSTPSYFVLENMIQTLKFSQKIRLLLYVSFFQNLLPFLKYGRLYFTDFFSSFHTFQCIFNDNLPFETFCKDLLLHYAGFKNHSVVQIHFKIHILQIFFSTVQQSSGNKFSLMHSHLHFHRKCKFSSFG